MADEIVEVQGQGESVWASCVAEMPLQLVEDGGKEVFRATVEGKIMANGVDITNDDAAIANCFIKWLKLVYGFEIQRG
jgi:hypothetical protein